MHSYIRTTFYGILSGFLIALIFIAPTAVIGKSDDGIKIVNPLSSEPAKVIAERLSFLIPSNWFIRKPESLKVPILLYHYVSEVTDESDELRPRLTVSPENFEAQLKFLKENGYTTITLSDLTQALQGKKKIPEKSVILTFDDGFKDFYTVVFPLLKKYDMKAINFIIITSFRLEGNLNDAEVEKMVRSGLVEIGAHSVSHQNLKRFFGNRLEREVVDSKKFLEDNLDIPIKHFSYPGGFYDDRVVAQVRQAGFETAVTTDYGKEHTIDDLMTLKRIKVGDYDTAGFRGLVE